MALTWSSATVQNLTFVTVRCHPHCCRAKINGSCMEFCTLYLFFFLYKILKLLFCFRVDSLRKSWGSCVCVRRVVNLSSVTFDEEQRSGEEVLPEDENESGCGGRSARVCLCDVSEQTWLFERVYRYRYVLCLVRSVFCICFVQCIIKKHKEALRFIFFALKPQKFSKKKRKRRDQNTQKTSYGLGQLKAL